MIVSDIEWFPINWMTIFKLGVVLLYWDDWAEVGMILLIVGWLSLKWDYSSYSGMIVYKLV